MVMKINARVLLELGAELISSDQIALYELVKNSLDARAKRIDVNVNVILQRSEFLRVVETIEFHENSRMQLDDSKLRQLLIDSFESETPEESQQEFLDAVFVVEKGRRLPALRDAYSKFNWVEVKDTGTGMSLDDLDNVYLTIGTPNRLIERSTTTHNILGEKGIGRLSAVRLGDLLTVNTTKAGEEYFNYLKVDWSAIKLEPTMMLDEFPAEPVQRKLKPDKEIHGTRIRINNLMSDWSEDKIRGLASTDFAKLVDPFLASLERPNIYLHYNGRKVTIPAFEFRQLTFAHANCTANFEYNAETGEAQLSGVVHYKSYARTKTFHLSGTHLRSALALKGKRPKKNQEAPELLGSLLHGLSKLGPFQMEVHWFNRQKLRLDKPPGYEEALSWLTRWGGGLLLYRDHYRVYPYAETRDDWLDLDGVALATSGYKMNRKQLVGAVRIGGRTNPQLLDQTNREGLRDTEEKTALITLLRHVLIAEFKSFLNAIESEQEESAAKEFPQLEKRLEVAHKEALKQVMKLRSRVTEKQDVAAINTLLAKMADMAEAWERSKLTVKKYERDIDSYMHLAGVGLMTEFIFHELARVSGTSLKILQNYKTSNTAEGAKLKLLKEQLITLEKRIRVLDPLSTPGRQQKETFDVVALMRDISDAHAAQWERHEITFDLLNLPQESVNILSVKGQYIQIIENLISNSVYWLKLEAQAKNFNKKITISIDTEKKQIIYLDNGPGIPEDRGIEVFTAFFSTKPAGEGRGMGLYISQKLAEGNGLLLELAPPDEKRLHRGFILRYEGAQLG